MFLDNSDGAELHPSLSLHNSQNSTLMSSSSSVCVHTPRATEEAWYPHERITERLPVIKSKKKIRI